MATPLTIEVSEQRPLVSYPTNARYPQHIIATWKEFSDSSIGAGYISSSHASYFTCLEESLELSRILGIAVHGVYGKSIRKGYCHAEDTSSQTLLLEIWEKFFAEHPQGHFLQYFYGSGGAAVQEALNVYTNAQIIVIGINPKQCPTHTPSYYFRSAWNFREWLQRRPNVSRLPMNPNMQQLGFTDPTFLCALLQPYLSLSPLPVTEEESIIIPEDLLNVLGSSLSRKHYGMARQVTLCRESDPELFDQACRLYEASRTALVGCERWNHSRIRSCYTGCVSYTRALLYGIMVLPHAIAYETLSFGKCFFTFIMIFYWSLSALGEGMLFMRPQVHFTNGIRLCAQLPGQSLHFFNLVEIIWNSYMCAVSSGETFAIHCSLLVFSTSCLFKEVLELSGRTVHEKCFAAALYLTHLFRPDLRRFSSPCKIDRTYRRVFRKLHFFFQIFCLMLVLGSTFSIHGFKPAARNESITMKSVDLVPGVFVGVLPLLLLVFLFLVNRAQERT